MQPPFQPMLRIPAGLHNVAAQCGIAREDLPFRKRIPYEAEREFRIVYVDQEEEVAFKHVAIELMHIQRITLSPWIHKSLSDAVRDTIKEFDGCDRLNVYRSTLIENERWKKIANPKLREEA